MRTRLCTYCIGQALGRDPEYAHLALGMILAGNLEVVVWSHNCDHFREKNHPHAARWTMEDLPPNARA